MLGQLPPGYNKAIHGPYDPAVYYGKPDLPLSQVFNNFFVISSIVNDLFFC